LTQNLKSYQEIAQRLSAKRLSRTYPMKVLGKLQNIVHRELFAYSNYSLPASFHCKNMNRNAASKMETPTTIALATSGVKTGGKLTLLRQTRQFAARDLSITRRPQAPVFACANPAGSRT
jgi:hypothetical protein